MCIRDRLIKMAVSKQCVRDAEELYENYGSKAKAALHPLEDSEAKEHLFHLVDFAVTREY